MIRRIMLYLKEAVDYDTINFGTVDLDTENAFHFSLDGFLMPEERRNLLPLFKHQNPMIEYTRKHGTSPPLRFTDFSSRRQFEESPIYRECYRGYTHSMLTFGIQAPSGLSTSFVLSRGSGDFSERDVERLEILQPLVSSIIQQRLLQESLAGSVSSSKHAGVIHGTGRFIHTMDQRANALIKKYLQPDSLHQIPDQFSYSLEAPIGTTREVPKALEKGARLLSRSKRENDSWSLLIWDENEFLSSEALSRYGFTGRQIEVIQWMAQGKTNPEIAVILSISYRTVQKHVENIYKQLGVETRLAAINTCREIVA